MLRAYPAGLHLFHQLRAAFPTARLSWCGDESPRPTRRIAAHSPAAARLRAPRAENTFTPMEKLGLHTSAAPFFSTAARTRSMCCEPAGGAHHHRNAHRRQRFDISEHRVRARVNSIATSAPAACFEIVIHVDAGMNREPVLRRELLDQPSHLPVTDNREFHSFECRRVRVAKNSRWSDSTARCRSAGGHHQADIQLRRALRNHAHVDVPSTRRKRAPRRPASGG